MEDAKVPATVRAKEDAQVATVHVKAVVMALARVTATVFQISINMCSKGLTLCLLWFDVLIHDKKE